MTHSSPQELEVYEDQILNLSGQLSQAKETISDQNTGKTYLFIEYDVIVL